MNIYKLMCIQQIVLAYNNRNHYCPTRLLSPNENAERTFHFTFAMLEMAYNLLCELPATTEKFLLDQQLRENMKKFAAALAAVEVDLKGALDRYRADFPTLSGRSRPREWEGFPNLHTARIGNGLLPVQYFHFAQQDRRRRQDTKVSRVYCNLSGQRIFVPDLHPLIGPSPPIEDVQLDAFPVEEVYELGKSDLHLRMTHAYIPAHLIF